jgi:putative endonuclease
MATDRGRAGERAARRALRAAGYRILDRNVRTPSGEIDVVALDGETLCVIEVKARSGDRHGTPEEALDGPKRRRLRAAARDLLRSRGLAGRAHRFDLVAVDLSPAGEPVRVRIHRDAM